MDYWHKVWTCPFFKWDDQQSIGCEGGKLRFYDKESAVEYMDKYCAGTACSWEQCTVAASLLKFYDRKEDNDHEQCERKQN